MRSGMRDPQIEMAVQATFNAKTDQIPMPSAATMLMPAPKAEMRLAGPFFRPRLMEACAITRRATPTQDAATIAVSMK